METSIGVFGEEMLLWMCMMRQSPRRPPPDHVHRQAGLLLDELKRSKIAMELPLESVDDGMFAIAALLDEWAMSLPDLRPIWSHQPLQSLRWMTHAAGDQLFERLARVREGPPTIIATYAVVLGMGFMGRFGLPGQNPYPLVQLRRELTLQLRVDPDRDWNGGVLKFIRMDEQSIPWYRSLLFARLLVVLLLLGGAGVLFFVSIYGRLQ